MSIVVRTVKLQLVLILLVVGHVSVCALSPQSSNQTAELTLPEVSEPRLRDELLAMSKADQDIRFELIEAGVDMPDEQLLAQMKTIDLANTVRMKEIVKQYGWPGFSKVGEEGAMAAFLLVQHADHDPAFQKRCLTLLQAAYEVNDVSGQHLALLTDRVLIAEGKPQRYGTQTQLKDGEIRVMPVEDKVNLDKRRAELGLPVMEEYLSFLTQLYELHPKQP